MNCLPFCFLKKVFDTLTLYSSSCVAYRIGHMRPIVKITCVLSSRSCIGLVLTLKRAIRQWLTGEKRKMFTCVVGLILAEYPRADNGTLINLENIYGKIIGSTMENTATNLVVNA